MRIIDLADIRASLVWKWVGVGLVLLLVLASSGGRKVLVSFPGILVMATWLIFTTLYSVGLLKSGRIRNFAINVGTAVSFCFDTVVTVVLMLQGIVELEDFWHMPLPQILSVYALYPQPRCLAVAGLWVLAIYGAGTGVAWRNLLGSPHMGTLWIHLVFSAAYIFGYYYRLNTVFGLLDKLVKMKRELEASSKELAEANELLARLSYTDSLTGLYNNRYFYERFEDEIGLARGAGGQLALIMLDLDHFKHYNDTCGHRQGDRLLREVAGIMSEKCRESDIVCRYGGEEFAIILPHTSRTEALGVAERIREAIATHPFEGRESMPGGVITISAGVAVFPDDGSTVGELIESADTALYRAKGSGRNAVRFHTH